jgi:cytochrome c biogenesis protein CcmG, thiol:disulfide interchange protein DsbE
MLQSVCALQFAVLVAPLFAAQEDPLQLMRNVAANYAALSKRSYDFEQVEVQERFGAIQNRTEQRRRIVGSGAKYREETLPSGILYLFDGQYKWVFNPDRNEYTKESASSGRPADLSTFETAAWRIKSARLLRLETLELDAGPVVCQVIEVQREPRDGPVQYSPMVYWIDSRRNLALKLRYSVTIAASDRPNPSVADITISFSKATIDEPVDQSLLRFTPPAEAEQVERLSFGSKSTLVGKQSPDFELKGIDGERMSSATLKGRPILLQFGPSADSESLLLLEMIYRALKINGLAAIYVVPQRGLGNANEAYTVPVATDGDGNAAKKFGVSYTGMILIDRSGKVAYADASSRNSTELVRALKAVGAW